MIIRRFSPVLFCSVVVLTEIIQAASLTVTLQRGLDGYEGVEDVMLYAPASVANVNYGRCASLSAGINRWGEQLVALIRFDLGIVPTSARVVQAGLWIYDNSKEWPARAIAVDVQAIAAANADWSEGSGDGRRTPTPDAACWSFRRYDKAKWAGLPGLRKPGVDYLTPPMGSCPVKKGHQGWLTFSLAPEIVQQWISDPKTNAGMRVFPLSAQQKGDVLSFHSSEALDSTLRPRLVVELTMDEAGAQTYRRSRAIRALQAVSTRLGEVRKAVAKAGNPARAVKALREVEGRSAFLSDQAKSKPMPTDEDLRQFLLGVDQIEHALEGVPDQMTIALAEAANRKRRWPTDFALGLADGMTNVLRAPALFKGTFSDTATIEMAKNEFEAMQVVIVPIDSEVSQASWTVTNLTGPLLSTIPAADVSVAVMGYLRARKPAFPTKVEWWPGPILDFMKSVDVPKGEVQPLWLCVRTRPNTPAGTYKGTITVSAKNAKPKSLKLRVRVFDFAIPKEQHLFTVWGNNESTFRRMYGDRYDKKMARTMFDFLVEHRLAVNDLYAPQAAGRPIGADASARSIGLPTLSDPNELRRLWDAGSRWWNLGYLHPTFAKSAKMDMETYTGKFIEMIRESLKVAEAAGWPRSNMGIYFFDETRDFEALNKAASRVKAAFPDIPLMTTGYDRSYGVKHGPIDSSIDIWCPLTSRYAEDEFTINEGRRYGKKAWWYVCCGPRGRNDLNFFSQFPAIRSRLLMGAATWKYKPDGFLYYRITGWTHYTKPIDKGPLTDWEPYYLPGPDGDGELVCPGPNGPLSTLQFENIRDGLEDFEYYWVLRDLVNRARRKKLNVSAQEKLLSVPPDFLSTLTSYSEDPARLQAERRKIAEAIVGLRKQVRW